VGGFSYDHEKAIDKFRSTCSQLKKPLPFVVERPDYGRQRTYVDMKDLMLKRRKEKARNQKLYSRQRHDDKWTIEGKQANDGSNVIVVGGREKKNRD
jgi:hypothetical protein